MASLIMLYLCPFLKSFDGPKKSVKKTIKNYQLLSRNYSKKNTDQSLTQNQ